MKSKLLIATKNPGKLKEFKKFLSDLLRSHSEFSSESREMLKPFGLAQAFGSEAQARRGGQVQHDKIKVVSLRDLNIKEEVEENGKTYKENSQKKALFYSKLSGLPTIADDGGIEIAALGGKPGIQSHRWFGEGVKDEEMVSAMIKVANEMPNNNRKAFFRTVVSFAIPSGKVFSVSGEVEGEISKKPYLKILKGYPYRSFFYLTEIKKFYHEDELTEDEQKMYNHRYKAISKLKAIIKKEMVLV